MDETERIKQYYEERKNSAAVSKAGSYTVYINQMILEREKLYADIILSKYKKLDDIQLLEVGAETGANLPFFLSLGIKKTNIFANELMSDRVAELKANFPDAHTIAGDALQLNFKNKFDLTFQSTVFTTILDDDFKKKLADKLWDMTKPGGIILWYDFTYDNPNNKSVKGIKKAEIKNLFKHSTDISFSKVTLAPPIGRRFQSLYKILNLFPFLRTHVIAVILKKE